MSIPAPLSIIPEDSGSEEFSRYLLTSHNEVVRALSTLVSNHEPIAAYFDGRDDSMLTALLEVYGDRNALVFDYSGSADAKQGLLASQKITFVARDNGIKIQFTTGRAKSVQFRGSSAFLTVIPRQLLRLQRREFYRAAVPISHKLTCEIEGQALGKVLLPVSDISVGGLGLIMNEGAEAVAIADRYRGKLDLPDIGEVAFELEVRNMRSLPKQENNVLLGCRFIDLQSKMQALVQRYLTKIEQEQHALRPDE